MTEPFVWRGISFIRSSESHRDYERWNSEVMGPYGHPLWAVEGFNRKAIWYARLLVYSHRFGGTGPNALLALDAAREQAKKMRLAISQALPKG